MSKRWYVVHTYSGYENRVKSDLEHRIETMGMQDRIFDIEIPMERVTDGPLTDFDGKVSEVNTEAGKLKVTLMIFGRETPVELDFNQVAVIA